MPRTASRPLIATLAAFFGVFVVQACAGDPAPSVAPSVTAAPVATPAPSASGESRVPITAADARKLFQRFQTALKLELRTRETEDAQEYRAFKTKQAQELRRWKESENDARKRFFEANLASPDRRAYMHGRGDRYKDYLAAQAQSRADLLKLQEERMRGLKSQQLVRAREFQEFLTRNEKPPAWLWGGQSEAGG